MVQISALLETVFVLLAAFVPLVAFVSLVVFEYLVVFVALVVLVYLVVFVLQGQASVDLKPFEKVVTHVIVSVSQMSF